MPKLDIKFKELRPGHPLHGDGDYLTVNAAGLRLSGPAYARMGYPESVRVEVSEDGKALRLSVPGPFHTRVITENVGTNPKPRPGAMVNAVVISRSAERGLFKHVEENLFMHE